MVLFYWNVSWLKATKMINLNCRVRNELKTKIGIFFHVERRNLGNSNRKYLQTTVSNELSRKLDFIEENVYSFLLNQSSISQILYYRIYQKNRKMNRESNRKDPIILNFGMKRTNFPITTVKFYFKTCYFFLKYIFSRFSRTSQKKNKSETISQMHILH